jgi:uncharacterized protein YndB with AHSA1/START domain
MATTRERATPLAAPELVITRVFDAPREAVWRAWTEPGQVQRWWGPKDYTAPACTIDLHVGGRYLFGMRSPEGQDYWSTGVYREIVPHERLVYTDSFADAQGNVVPASHYGMPGDWPLEMEVSVTFEAHGDRTKMTLRHVGLPAGDMAEMTGAGWNESFDKIAAALARRLVVTLPSDHEIQMSRVFDAPRRLVFDAHTSVEHMRHWWGPRGFTMVSGEMDFRPGGAWRFVLRKPDGREYAFRGEFREIVPPERIVWTFEFEGEPGQVAVETLTLVERDGKTTLTTRSVASSREARDAVLRSGMEQGAAETWDRLEEYLGRLR